MLVSQYIIPLIVFPYVSRVLGVEYIGIVNFADGIVNYFILFSTLGLTLVGVREIAKSRTDRKELNKVFSELFTLHLLMTILISAIYLAVIFFFEKFKAHPKIYLFGLSKLVFNLLLIEWFFRGIENFKFITIRSILIKIIYVFLVFALVRERSDYAVYFYLTCLITVLNGIVNWWFSRSYVSFSIKGLNLKRHFASFFVTGSYMILTSMYTTFNVAYLGLVSTDHAVGNYTTSLKLYTIIMGVFSALNTVMLPKLSSLVATEDSRSFEALINKSLLFVSTFCFPIIASGIVLAPEIMATIAGPGFENATLCFRIIIPLIFIVGVAQIMSNQILMPLKKERVLAIISFVGAVLGITLNLILVPVYSEIGSSIVVLISEFAVSSMLFYCCLRYSNLNIEKGIVLKNLLASLPCLVICGVVSKAISNPVLVLSVSAIFCGIYLFIIQLLVLRNSMLFYLVDKLRAIKRPI